MVSGKEEHSGRTGVGLVSPWAITGPLPSTSFVASAEFSAAHGKHISVSGSIVAHLEMASAGNSPELQLH